MSGGHFNYEQNRISDIAYSIEEAIYKNGKTDKYGYTYNFTDKTIKKFREAKRALDIAFVYAHAIDWLLSGDDSEETFHERLKNDLVRIK